MHPLLLPLQQISSHTSSRLIISNEYAWVVLHSFTPANRILFEVASNLYLPDDKQLSDTQIKTLFDWGYQKRRQGRSIGTMTYLSSEQDCLNLAEKITKIFSEIFHLDPQNSTHQFQKNVKHGIDNKHLHSAMRQLVNSKDHKYRIALYQALVNAKLLVYLTEDNQDFIPYDTIGEFITYAAFTDDKYIQQFDPRGCTVREMYVYDFIPALVSKNAGSLILNPKGDIRGELYKNELASINTALRRTNR